MKKRRSRRSSATEDLACAADAGDSEGHFGETGDLHRTGHSPDVGGSGGAGAGRHALNGNPPGGRPPSARRGDAADDEGLLAVVDAAAGLLGWLVPLDEAEILLAEADLPDAPVAPAEPQALMAEAMRVFAAPTAGARTFVHQPPPLEAGEGPGVSALARAARRGGSIPPAVEARMAADRKAAETAAGAGGGGAGGAVVGASVGGED